MNSIKELQPQLVWDLFDQITKVPRPSKKEEKIRAFLRELAAKHNIDFKEDEKGNIVMRKAATVGFENVPGVILQSHMDMVCEKEPNSTHNFELDPIDTYIDNGWVRARGTTLGADCGIGMALQLAVILDNSIQHPAIEALFTVDEEQGLSGADELGGDMLTLNRMINLDSEDEGEIFIGCAGGVDTIARYKFTTEPVAAGAGFVEIAVGSLVGGHSGDDINKGRANANKLITRLLIMLSEKFSARLCSIDGGNLRNAIARNAQAVVAIPEMMVDSAKKQAEQMIAEMKAEFAVTEPQMTISVAQVTESTDKLIDAKTSSALLNAMNGLPNGVIANSPTMPGLVETSTNLASVKMRGDVIEVVTSQRSSVESAKAAIASSVHSVFALSGALVEHTDGYPGWTPNPDSDLVRMSARLYKQMFGHEAKIKAIHAGLECGLFLSKYPALDMISIGPTLRDVHSPTERLEICTVDMVWSYLLALLAQK